MDTSGQAAEQIVRYSMEGMEYTLKFTGRAAERLAAILMALAKDQQKTKGKTTLHSLLKSGKELTVFSVPESRMKEFTQEARRYGVLYCALKEKNPNDQSLTDIMVRAEDAAKLNRIIERLGLNQVEITGSAPVLHSHAEQEEQAAEELLEKILSATEKAENPTFAQTGPSSPSGHGSRPSGADIDPHSRPSVRAALAQIRREQNAARELEKTESAAEQQLSQITEKER